ncbi:TonB-dependent receptor [Flagellimonas algicola]|nr:TonB-dependent receptor [Allomuricauda algicola]
MKIYFLLVCFSMVKVLASDLYAQNITLNMKNAKLKTILKEIEKKSDYSFFYNSSIVNVDKKRSLSVNNTVIDDALSVLFLETEIDYSYVRNQIILFPKNQPEIKEKIENLLRENEQKVSASISPEKINEVLIDHLQNTITGTVVDAATNIAVPGASVVVKNTNNGTATDFDGLFTLEAAPDAVLIVSYLGYRTMEVPVNGQTNLTIQMQEDASQLDEVVVVGYGTQRKATVTGAVTAVKGAVLESSPAISVSNSLAGRLPGVVIIQTSGEPGNDESNITIRGTNTLGNNQPLVVIDGIPDRDGGIGRLNPNDIENISVLKDASAAIYGARAANGAIIVTTKQGQTGKPTITYTADFGLSQPTFVPEMSNAVEYADIRNELPIYNLPASEWTAASQAIRTNGSYTPLDPGTGVVNAVFSPADVQGYLNQSDPYLYPDSDWFDATFKDWTSQSRHNLSISGGSEKIKYFSSLGYSDQDGIYENSSTRYQQYNFRLNTTATINDYVTAKMGMAYRKEDRSLPTESSDAIFRMLMRGKPTDVAVWPGGLPGPDIENGQQPVVIATNETGYDREKRDYLQFTGSVDITNPWIDGLKLTLLAGVDQRFDQRKLWETPWDLYFLDRDTYVNTGEVILNGAQRSSFTAPQLQQWSRNQLNVNLTALLNYEKSFGDHTIGALAGVTRETINIEELFGSRLNFLSDAIDQLTVGGEDGQVADGVAFNRNRLGYYGRVQYNFKEKYLAEFIWRYDGSYIFPENDRFGFFPGFLVGWNISNEEFFNVDFVNNLKIRASYGQMGNDQVAFDDDGDGLISDDELREYAYLSIYDFNRYPINGAVQTTILEPLLANNNFTWERANNFNIGLDGRLMDNKIAFVLEYFLNKRDQILIQQTGSTPGSSGIADRLPPVNAGEVTNKGFEFALNYFGGDPDGFSWDAGINGGVAKNTVDFMDEVPGAPSYQRMEGKPIRSHFVFQSDGAFLDEAEIAANTLDYSGVTSQLRPGDMKFKDINNDGVIDGDDQVRLDENDTPTFNFGATFNASYKNFDLSVLLQGATGASLRIFTESGDIGNYLKYSYDNRWSIDNPSSVHPRLASRGDTYYTGGSFGQNSYLLFSKDYLRIKNVSVGYNFPTDVIAPFGLSAARVYLSGLNLATFAENKIFDPESNAGNGRAYPQSRVINAGFSLTF